MFICSPCDAFQSYTDNVYYFITLLEISQQNIKAVVNLEHD